MAVSFHLTDGSLITDNGIDCIVGKKDGQKYIVSCGKVLNSEHESLSKSEVTAFRDDLLHAEFFISADKAIRSTEIKQNTEGKFRLLINAGNKDNSTAVELKQEADTITIAHNSADITPTNHGSKTKTHRIHALSSATDREYVDYKTDVDKDHGEKFETENSISLKRNIKGKGQRLLLSRDVVFYEDEGFITQNSNLTSIEISADEITKSNSIDDTKYRQKLKIDYDLKKGRIQCRLKKKEYEAITIVEYKNTILTAKTGKKVKVTTFVDRDFDGQLDLHDDGTFTYVQERTDDKGMLVKTKIQDDIKKVPDFIMREVEQLKAIAGKIAVLRNSQQHAVQINFALNPSVFDEEIKFSEVKDKDAAKLADSLFRGGAETNRKLLAAVIQTADGNSILNIKGGNPRV